MIDDLEELYRARRPQFCRAAAAITGDRALGGDAVQDAFAKAVRRRRSYRGRGSLEAWVWRIVLQRGPRRAPQTGPAARSARPPRIPEPEHGVIEIQTADGPQDLWVAPSDQGGTCYFIDWANDVPGPGGQQFGFGAAPSLRRGRASAGGTSGSIRIPT